jgi:hypothetical protein
MMYVEGNPVGYRDPSGNALSNSWMYAIGTYMIAKNQGLSDQQAMVWAVSAYGVGRGKDRNSGDIWKNNDISRAITSGWGSYLRSDFGHISASLGRQFSDYVKNPLRSLERSDLARSDLGTGITDLWRYLSKEVNWSLILTGITIVGLGIIVLPFNPAFGVVIMTTGVEYIAEGLTGIKPEGTPGQNPNGVGIQFYP